MSSVSSTSETSLAPQQGEPYAAYLQRAHQSLMSVEPDWDARNQKVWAAWDKANGNDLRQRSQKYFAKDCTRFVPDVCYFLEHETIGRDGKPVRYSFSELAAIADEHNSRAVNHNYSAIADRHTSDRPQPKGMEPEVLGYAGAARMGMVGDKWAVFLDEHHRKDGIEALNKKQRRSVEVNRYRDGRRPYFDPIAALGADSPRLPLPVARYSTDEDEALVEHYSVMAPAMVAGGNTFIPSLGPKKDEEKISYSEPASMGIGEDDVAAIVQAIQATPEMQWVKSQMGAASAPGQTDELAQPAGSPVPHSPQPAPQPPQHGGAAAGGAPMGQQQQQQPPGQQQRYSKQNDPGSDGADRYAAMQEQIQDLAEENADLAEKYSQVHEVNKDLMLKLTEQHEAVVNLERRAVDAERTDRLRDLYQAHKHFVVLEEELDKCLYSRGSEMSHEAFESHVEDVENYAKRSSPVTRMVPGGALPSDQYSQEKDLGRRVVERYTQLADQGVFKSYDEITAEVKKELAGE